MPRLASESDGSRGDVARKLNLLLETKVNPETGEAYTNAELGRATGLSASLITQLKQGTKDNPTKNTLERLAEHFGVKPSFFFQEMSPEHEDRVIAGLKMLDAVEASGLHALAARANGLSADSLRMIATVIETARKAEGLDDCRKVDRRKGPAPPSSP